MPDIPAFPYPTWERLTRSEATNFVITLLIVGGFDPAGELIIDGDPGPFLEKISKRLQIPTQTYDERGVGTNPNAGFSFDQFLAFTALREIAWKVGYRGTDVMGIVPYLQGLPEKGPIGKTNAAT